VSMCGASSSSSSHSPHFSGGDRSKHGRGIRVSTLARFTKLKFHRNGNEKTREKARQYLTERHALSLHETSTQQVRPRKPRPHRSAHSEGETLSEDEVTDVDFRSTVARLKKVSLRKFRAWKS